MENIKIDATERSPEVDLDFTNNMFAIRGESYPEDATAFFGPLLARLEAHFKALSEDKLTFDFELIYFNSSSAKVLMSLFDLLEETAGNGNAVTVTWTYEDGDDNMRELGEEFGEDLRDAGFELREVPGE